MAQRTPMREHGVVMFVSLLLLIILSIIGIAGMSTSIFDLRIAGNTQRLYDSFQSADAGLAAAMSDEDTFDGSDKSDLFAGGDPGSTEDYIVAEVNVERVLPDVELSCPRSPDSSSVAFIGCEHYTVDSEHQDAVTGARTQVYQGVVREIIAR